MYPSTFSIELINQSEISPNIEASCCHTTIVRFKATKADDINWLIYPPYK